MQIELLFSSPIPCRLAKVLQHDSCSNVCISKGTQQIAAACLNPSLTVVNDCARLKTTETNHFLTQKISTI